MIEPWLRELWIALERFLLNPLLYWSFIYIFLMGRIRIQTERDDFGTRIFRLFTEWKDTWFFSIRYGIYISILFLGIGIVFSIETLFFLTIVTILLSLTLRNSLLSSSYTIGLTFIILLLAPKIIGEEYMVNEHVWEEVNFIGLVMMLAVFLIAEAILLRRTKRDKTYPSLTKSSRGAWIGQHHIKKIALIPFLTLVPTGAITSFAPFWPYLPLGSEERYSLIAVPFLLGFNYQVKGSLPQQIAKQLGNKTFLLGLLVLLIAIGSIYVPALAIIGVAVAILGKEFIRYKQRTKDQGKAPYFFHTEHGLKILGIIPETPATQLDLHVGEVIHKVNDITITNVADFYYALQTKGAQFKLSVFDDKGEIRFVHGAMYEGEHHELGLIFTDRPYAESKESTVSLEDTP